MSEFHPANGPADNLAADSDGTVLVSKTPWLDRDLARNPMAKPNGILYGNEAKLLKFIPPMPESYSFVDENFHSDAFSVDGFVKRNSRKVHSLEKLKEELTAYMKILKHSMIDLINEDYTEFINLSTNLISFDKSINNIKTPILKFKDETSHVQCRIESIISQLNAKQNRLRAIRDNKLRINMIVEIISNLNRLETNRVQSSLGEQDNGEQLILSDVNFLALEENATLVSRIQMNFDYLLAKVDIPEKNSTHLLVKLKQRFDKCSRQFYLLLEKEICQLLSFDLAKLSDETKLTEVTRLIEKIIRIYLLNDNQKELERIICENIVKPHFDLFIFDSYIAKNGVESMFERILEFVDTQCALLIKVLATTHNDSTRLSTMGYELLTATIWKEFVDDCLVRTSSLFSLANADNFYENYALTFRFVEDFLHKTSLVEYRERFENQKNYHQLKSKFNLNVYFYMKLQQIVPNIERGFIEFRYTLCAIPNRQYRLNVTNLIHDSLFRCWHVNEEKSYVGDLFGYLWKISLKIVSRFACWMANTSTDKIADWQQSSTDKRLVHQTLAALIFDAQTFTAHLATLYQSVITPLWANHYARLQSKIGKQDPSRQITIEQSSLNASFNEMLASFHTVALQHLIGLMKTEIITECTASLDLVNDIPRLYRRTNKEKPSKASSYIVKCCQQLCELIALIGVENNDQWRREWIAQLLCDLTLYYKNATLEVLTSVQKTEDSLKKLKKTKPVANRNATSSMSDDDKIRLQIYYDVRELHKELQSKLQIDLRSIKPYDELSKLVSSLETLI